MSLSILYSRAQLGIQAPLVTVETHLSNGLPRFSIVGLPEAAVKESKDRVRSALLNLHFELPPDRTTINLAPADLPKEGGRFDLPIALGILIASGQLPVKTPKNYEFAGELALSGELRPIQGTLPLALSTKKTGRTLIIPFDNANEAALVKDLNVLPARHLMDVCKLLKAKQPIQPHRLPNLPASHEYNVDLSDIYGQYHAKRALEIAATGGHSMLLVGPPGTGKTMLANRLGTILPEMTDEEALESAAILSISHRGFDVQNWKKHPFRAPHHSASSVALVGGGSPPNPGEISLAHLGILFLDELPEFNRHVLESLREPLESGIITISRAARQSEFPANFQLIAAMNPCPCGYLGDKEIDCRCTPEQIKRYHMKISGPLLDRIDMHLTVARLPLSVLSQEKTQPNESSLTIRQRVEKTVQIQLTRQGTLNAKLSNKALEQVTRFTSSTQKTTEHILQKLQLSARSYHRLLKVARTIADFEQSDKIEIRHFKEALGFRGLPILDP